MGHKRPGGVRRVLRGNRKPRAGNPKRATRQKPNPVLTIAVVVRRWRWGKDGGFIYTREYKRTMTFIGRWHGHVEAKHWICEEGPRYDGSPYDMMEVKFYGLAGSHNKVSDRGRNSRPASVRVDIKGKGSGRRRGSSISPTTGTGEKGSDVCAARASETVESNSGD